METEYSRFLETAFQGVLAFIDSHSTQPIAIPAYYAKQDILDLALDRERIIIRFYTDLVGIVRDSAGKNTVDDVIKEEKRHVVILKRSLALLNDTDSSGHSE